jgi:hypothetical protein
VQDLARLDSWGDALQRADGVVAVDDFLNDASKESAETHVRGGPGRDSNGGGVTVVDEAGAGRVVAAWGGGVERSWVNSHEYVVVVATAGAGSGWGVRESGAGQVQGGLRVGALASCGADAGPLDACPPLLH